MPALKQAWPKRALCWSPATPPMVSGAPSHSAWVWPKSALEGRASGIRLAGMRRASSSSLSQLAGVDVEQHGARGVAVVGGVHRAAGEVPDQPAVDGTEGQLAALGLLAHTGHVVQDPGQLGGGEVGVDAQAGFLQHAVAQAALAQVDAGGLGAPVLPDDGVVHRLARFAVPDHGGFALVGDADGADVGGAQPAFFRASRAVSSWVRQSVSGSCSTQPGCG